MFHPVPPERFASFHAEFHGDTWDVCTRCGGRCEINKIGSLMPGEAEYIAAGRGQNVREFREEYLDGIATPDGVVDVLKLMPGCPFLSAEFRCTIPDVKVVLCDVYPVVFEVRGGDVEFALDPWCPIVRFVPDLARIFEEDGIPALRRVGAPAEWYRAVQHYDGLCVDYGKLFAGRAERPGYDVFTMEQILSGQARDAAPPVLAPFAPTPGQCRPHNPRM